jgi:hypothetical protein
MGCDATPTLPNQTSLVVRAYLYAGEPVTDVQITSTMDLATSDTVPPPVNDAAVTLIKGGTRYVLTATAGDTGYYHYAGSDLTVAQGDTFNIEVIDAGDTATGTTVVPAPPDAITLSDTLLVVPTFQPGQGGGGPGRFNPDSLSIRVTWPAVASALYFVTVTSVDSAPQEIGGGGRRRRFISQPTPADSFVVGAFSLSYYGHHVVRVYRVNQEYAQLYASRQQDSRDLNEPVTNIHNGLGVFSGFNSRTGRFVAVAGSTAASGTQRVIR